MSKTARLSDARLTLSRKLFHSKKVVLIFLSCKCASEVQNLMLFLHKAYHFTTTNTPGILTLPASFFSITLNPRRDQHSKVFDMPAINLNYIITLLSSLFAAQHVLKALFDMFRGRDEGMTERILIETFGGKNKYTSSSRYRAEGNSNLGLQADLTILWFLNWFTRSRVLVAD